AGGVRMLADTEPRCVEVAKPEVDASVARSSSRLMAVCAIIVEIRQRACAERFARRFTPLRGSRRCGRFRRAAKISHGHPARELICDAITIREILVQVARLRANGLQDFVVVVTLMALIGVRDLVRE